MNILLLGSGGREHALARKMSQSKHCKQLFIAPGNGGTGQYGQNIQLVISDFEAISAFCKGEQINMLVVGAEDPLVNGIFDFISERNPNIKIIGPSKYAAQLEGSKAFAKEFMRRNAIPTAGYREFNKANYTEGLSYINNHTLPIVLKADGLAAGKGVVICQNHTDALRVFEDMIKNGQFGQASEKVVIEEFLDGIEVSVFVVTDGKGYQIIGHAKDYKRIGEGDTGPNTGGMGCVSPVPFVDAVFMQKIVTQIINPTIDGLHKEDFNYMGFVFFGIIKVGDLPMLIEYNCRMGDPETEVVLPRLSTDLVELFIQMHNGTIAEANIVYEENAAATVVVVSAGYPGIFEKGKQITLPPDLDLNNQETTIFHAGTKRSGHDDLFTNGGRVLAITSLAPTIQQAAAKSKAVAEKIQFDGKYFRNDIGYEFE